MLKGIQYANSKGLKSRVVSNGYWAKNIEHSKRLLRSLKESGMIELNVSTGDNHQKFVSIDNVMKAIYSAVSEGIQTAIMIEVTKNSRFTQEDLKNHSLYKRIEMEGLEHFVEIANSPWVSLTNDNKYEYNEIQDLEIQNGCDNLFNYLAVDSFNDVYSCCGITVRRIEQMKIGNSQTDNLVEKYRMQETDFIKKWLYTSGPINIIRQVKEWNDNVIIPKFAHHCQFCGYLYNNEEILKTIKKNKDQIESQVNQMFKDKIEFSLLFTN